MLDAVVQLTTAGSAAADGYALDATPGASRWCLCFLSTGRHRITIHYRNADFVQHAVQGIYVTITESWPARLQSCGLLLLALAILIWCMIAIVNFFRTHRFPRRSRLGIIEPGQDYERLVKFRGWNWTLPRLLLWPFEPPHESKRAEGFMFTAAQRGATLSVRGEWPAFQLVRLGESLEKLLEKRRDRQHLELVWDDVLEEMERRPLRITLLRDYSNRRNEPRRSHRRR